MQEVIRVEGMSRSYEVYSKSAGLRQSVSGFFHRKTIEKVALEPLSLSISRGEVVGLVGANGAGKTTLIKILSGLIHPSAGDCHVLGYRPWKREYDYLRRMSVLLGQKAQLWWDIPPADSFSLLGKIYGIKPQDLKNRISELADVLKVGDQLSVQLRRLSLGERMKMEFIGCLLHRPQVIFLDEPTIGLDIVAQAAIRTFLKEYVRIENPTIILTSHYMDDIASMASRLLLMSRGSLVYDGTVSDFRKTSTTIQRIFFRLEEPLLDDFYYNGALIVGKGESFFKGEIPTDSVADCLSRLMSLSKVVELTIEQTEFEDVIHKFLATESGVHPARNSPAP